MMIIAMSVGIVDSTDVDDDITLSQLTSITRPAVHVGPLDTFLSGTILRTSLYVVPFPVHWS